MQKWDESFDAVVVGAGAAGLTAALTAATEGLGTLLVEKAEVWGGSTALSGGGLWIPCNPLMQAAGGGDTLEAAQTYFDAVVKDIGPATSRARRDAYLTAAPEMIEFVLDQGVAIEQEPGQPDYHAERPGGRRGRLMEPKFTDGHRLGPWLATLRPAPRPLAVKTGEGSYVARGFSSVESTLKIASIAVRHHGSRLLGQSPMTSGAALAAQLMMAAQRAGVTVRLSTPLKRIIVEDGRAVGVEIEEGGTLRRVEARNGVFLCGGGFAHNATMRQAVQPVDGRHSSASPEDTGDVIAAATSIGAATELMDEAWWGPCVVYPGGAAGFTLWERTMPGSLMVDDTGKRFTNEAASYDAVGRAMLNHGVTEAWLIFDSRHRRRYVFQAMAPGQTPKAMFDAGFFKRADTIEGLAPLLGLDAPTLKATVGRHDAFARKGVDEDFHRGEHPYDRYWGDPTNKPNPNLAPLGSPPFLATRIHLGDLGTKGGLLTDETGRVLRRDGSVIEGLYASGNSTASVMGRGYPGPGATLGPAMTFAYLAARDAAKGWPQNAEPGLATAVDPA
jgi:3-oxosteroid 1-dehydrogenase